MIKHIVFYNQAHLGDQHLTRHYVRMFPRWFPDIKFQHTHWYSRHVLEDTKVEFIEGAHLLGSVLSKNGSYFIDPNSGVLYLNTWVYALGNISYCTFQSAEALMRQYFDTICRTNNIVNPPTFMSQAPSIAFNDLDFDKESIAARFTRNGDMKSVFICNNYVRNNQADNINLNDFIIGLARQFPNSNFYLTNKIKDKIAMGNVFYAEDFLDIYDGFGLNQLSYFSTFCDVIIGRGSGPFTYCEISDNLDKTWISMTYPHLGCDVFNGLNKYPHEGQFVHTHKEVEILSTLEKILI